MDTLADELKRKVDAVVADWVATLLRPYPSAADLDRLVERTVAAVRAVVSGAEARTNAVTGAVEATTRDLHAQQAHQAPFDVCPETPCRPIREALARAARSA
ncbi:MAG TPA: hypothetical protein VIM86_09660 [Thermodesulfobacteriota bacterium]